MPRASSASARPSSTAPRRAARPRHRRHRGARRARLSPASVPVADLEPAHRRIWRLARKPHALPARSVRRGARGVPADKPVGMRVSSTDWVEGGWDLAQTMEFAPRAEGARRRLDRCLLRRRLAAAEDSARPRLPGAVRRQHQARDRPAHHRRRPDHRSASRPRRSLHPARPTWSRSPAACSTTRAGLASPPPKLGGEVEAPPQYWRSQPSTQKALFGKTTFGAR